MFLDEDNILEIEIELDVFAKFKVIGVDDINFQGNSNEFKRWVEHDAESVLKFEPFEIEDWYEYPEIDEEIIECVASVKLERIKEACYE